MYTILYMHRCAYTDVQNATRIKPHCNNKSFITNTRSTQT